MEQKIKFVRNHSKTSMTFCFLFFSILMLGSVSAGFGSTYLPDINGKNTLQMPIGSNSDYYIYPQNAETKVMLVKIKILNGSDLISNTLQEIYEVPVNTASDEFPIKITFKLNNDTSLIGKEFYFAYEILSTLKGNETGLVTFNPIGYKKFFYIKGLEPVKITLPIVNVTTPTTNQNGGGSSRTIPVRNATDIITPKPQQPQNLTPNTNDEPNLVVPSEIPTGSNSWIYLLIIGGLFVFSGTIFAIRWLIHKAQDNSFNYVNQEINDGEADFNEIK